MPSDLERTIATFRAMLGQRERRIVEALVRDYHGVLMALQPHLEAIGELIAAAEANGEKVTLAQLHRSGHLKRIEEIVITELETITGKTYAQIIAEQGHVATLAATQAVTAGRSAGVTMRALQPRAVEQIVGALQEGSPLRALLGQLPGAAAERIRDSLVQSVALGRNPRLTARLVNDALGGNMARALTISRTETLRAYRAATIQTYRENSGVLRGWTWVCAMDARSCASCIAMHGSTHPFDEPMGTHPSCRCSAAPWLRSEPSPVPAGESIFEDFSEDRQRTILGGAAFRAYQDGAITLPDLVKVRESPAWGTTRSVASLREVLGTRAAARYYAS